MSYRNYKIKLDTARDKTNKDMSFYISDIQSDQFTLTITEKGQVFDVTRFVLALIAVSPKNVVSTQYIDNIDSNVCTIKLERQMMNEVGQWTCRAALFNDECMLVLDSFTYTVHQDELTKVEEAIQEDDRFPLLMQLLNDNKLIEEAEKQRVISENERITNEQQRAADEEIRQSKEVNRQQSEINRNQHEQQRIEAEQARQDNEANRQSNEQARQSNYNALIDEMNTSKDEFNAYTEQVKVNEEQRKADEIIRQQEEQIRIDNEVQRMNDEGTRKANEVVRESNETSRQNIFENKVDEVDEKIVELNTSKDNFVSSINTKVNTKISEIEAAKSDMTNTVSNKVNEIETRFNALTSTQQQSSEVIDARDGEVSLKARLDRDIEKAKQIYVDVEGSNISTDSSSGYAKDIEILGNTIQSASDLADIRSVGDKVEGQELYEIPVVSCGKNLFNSSLLYDKLATIYPSSVKKSEVDGRNCVEVLNSSYLKKLNFLDRYKENTVYSVTMDVKYSRGTNEKIGICFSYTDETVDHLGFMWTPESSVEFNTGKCSSNPGKTVKLITLTYSNSGAYYYIDLDSIQIEEGTQATPYEPHQEDKLTILSPVQLEKVGDVADRIIEKDGVWGVEKNVETVVLNGSEGWSRIYQGTVINSYRIQFNQVKPHINTSNEMCNIVCDKFIPYTPNGRYRDVEQITVASWDSGSDMFINKSKSDVQDVNDFKQWLQANNVAVKYITTQPQFIPLPHDQQVKLRTFANRTNIHFETEIEGTIKAQVPKSIGATVNTHTEQINNLNKELDRVKKLEESTVSTITTESGFTTVEETSNGYFEDIKLEGKTLVVNDKNEEIEVGADGARLMSVGQDVEEVSVMSSNGNLLCTSTLEVGAFMSQKPFSELNGGEYDTQYRRIRIKLNRGSYVLKSNSQHQILCRCFYEGCTVLPFADSTIIYVKENNTLVKISFKEKNNAVWTFGETTNDIKLILNKGDILQPYQIPMQNKKPLLYYNPTTETWEKPVLRQWDSIEKHSDGKYYYHKRSDEVVLNGSEDWSPSSSNSTLTNVVAFYMDNTLSCITDSLVICDKLPSAIRGVDGVEYDNIYISTTGRINISILKSKLSTQDVAGFKQWLQANPVTVVYQLAQEEVYECTNIDLITYENETNYVVNSGAIVPRTTLKVMCNINNVVRELQQKVSNLENYIQYVMIDALNNALNE